MQNKYKIQDPVLDRKWKKFLPSIFMAEGKETLIIYNNNKPIIVIILLQLLISVYNTFNETNILMVIY